MKLLVDLGNTRLKWAMANGLDLITGTPLENAKIDRTALVEAWQGLAVPDQLAISCVGSGQLFELVSWVAQELWPYVSIYRAKSQAKGFGVTNAYQEPEKLGVDRWLAIIAGYYHYNNGFCIVDCGTAITVDVVDPSGRHLGGLISPGLRLMKEALGKGTENLNPSHEAYPFGLANFTDAAVYNGSISAACGLIEFVLKNQPDSIPLLLTGGDSNIIAAHLSSPFIFEPDLVLKGLALVSHKP